MKASSKCIAAMWLAGLAGVCHAQARPNGASEPALAATAGASNAAAVPAAASSRHLTASATGFVVSTEGHLLTTRSAVEGCTRLRVTLAGAAHGARLVARDAGTALALLQLDGAAARVRDRRLG